eukprot:TRINITY_DN51592_c0_g1_i1.p1 TRINITY_DN51592_c0_g1~~TRINITY_DN51592_c0_g1_i1.p1  ORF type:complete len:180 (-),score=18.50 TRINITY_DN51592_c0_g1_i1:63-602(-)
MATSWHNSGGPKFYEGNKSESIWNKNLHQKSMNDKESKFLLEIQAGTHESQQIPVSKHQRPYAVDTARSGSRTTARSSGSGLSRASSRRMNDAIGDLHEFNSSLRDELAELKQYLHATYDRLEKAEKGMKSGRGTSRSRSSSRCSSRSARSEVQQVIASARSAIERSSPKKVPQLNLGH